MAKYHVNENTGTVGKCTAKPGNCPVSNEQNHFANKAEANKTSERILEKKLGNALKRRKTNEYIPKPKTGVSELAFTVTQSDKDTTDYQYAIHNKELLSPQDRVEYFKNPDNPELKKKLKKAIADNFSDEEHERKAKRIAQETYFLKAQKAGMKLTPEIEEELQRVWNTPDNMNLANKVEAEEKLYFFNKAVKTYEETGKATVVFYEEKTHEDTVARIYRERDTYKKALETEGRSLLYMSSVIDMETRDKVNERLLTPTDEDRQEATDELVDNYVSSFDQYAPGTADLHWKNLMGEKRRTKNNVIEYRNKVAENLKNAESFDYEARVRERAEKKANDKFFARRYKEGYVTASTFLADDAFEEEWAKRKDLVSEDLEFCRRAKRDLETGAINPKDVLDNPKLYRNPKQEAIKTYEDRIKDFEEQFATRGRSSMAIIQKLRRERAFG